MLGFGKFSWSMSASHYANGERTSISKAMDNLRVILREAWWRNDHMRRWMRHDALDSLIKEGIVTRRLLSSGGEPTGQRAQRFKIKQLISWRSFSRWKDVFYVPAACCRCHCCANTLGESRSESSLVHSVGGICRAALSTQPLQL